MMNKIPINYSLIFLIPIVFLFNNASSTADSYLKAIEKPCM